MTNPPYLAISMGCLSLPYQEEKQRPIFLAVWKKSAGKENCEDYYPFGLSFNSYSREHTVTNQWKFQGQEHQDELHLGWDSFKWRNHMPEIGRFFNIDPLADKYVYNSQYAFAENKLGLGRELEGLELAPFNPQTTHPFTIVAEGFRQAFDAVLSSFSFSAEVHVQATGNERSYSSGTTEVSTSTSNTSYLYAQTDFSDIMDYSGNNNFSMPSNAITSGSKNVTTQDSQIETTSIVQGVPVNLSLTQTLNKGEQTITTTAQASVGIDRKSVEANAFVNVSTQQQANGKTTTSEVSAGVELEVPVAKTAGTTFSFGGSAAVSINTSGTTIINRKRD